MKSKPSVKKPRVSMICAISKNRGIGLKNKLLFDIPADLNRFRQITRGHPVIMGARTYYSIGHPLPDRLNIVLSQNDELQISGCSVCNNIDDALRLASESDQTEVFFIGGGMVYKQGVEYADRLYLTIVDSETEADTFFPDYSEFTKIVSSEDSVDNGYKLKYLTLERS